MPYYNIYTQKINIKRIIMIIADETISNLTSSKDGLDQALAEKDNLIEDMKIQIHDLKTEITSLQTKSDGSEELKHALLEEQTKSKEAHAKVMELTEFILARDETISQLKLEATKSLEELKALEDNSTAESASQINEIESLNKVIIDKVPLIIYTQTSYFFE